MVYLTIADKVSIFFSSMVGKAGTIAFGSTFLFWSIFAAFADFSSINFMLGETATTTGTVLAWSGTNTTINEQPVLGFSYAFELNGLPYSGESYSHIDFFNPQEEVTIEYLLSNPEISRIQGLDTSTMPLFVLAIIGVFPAIGFIIFFLGIKKAASIISVLSNAESARAELVDSRRTNTKINNRSLYALTFKYEVRGEEFKNVTKSVDPYKFENQEELIYSSIDPSKSVLKKSLPQKIASKADLVR